MQQYARGRVRTREGTRAVLGEAPAAAAGRPGWIHTAADAAEARRSMPATRR